MKRHGALASAALWFGLVATSGIAAQESPPPGRGAEPAPAAEPIRCWSRSGKSAVYLGERFSLTVTCRIADTAAVRVGVEESDLDPAAIQLSPFDVMDGTRFPDLQDEGHRLFQYQYSLRIIADDLFGSEVSIPPLDIRYRVQRAAGPGPAVEGAELVYRLPALPVRVATLASPQAVDIRDAPAETLGDIQSRRLRGSISFAVAALLFSGALGCVAMAAGGVMRRHGTAPRAAIRLSDSQVLDGAVRELQRLRQHVDRAGWDADAIGQALAAVRLGKAIALGQRPPQIVVDEEAPGQEGTLVIRSGLIRPRRLMVSASVTGETATAGPARGDGQRGSGAGGSPGVPPDDFRGPLNLFTAARYGRHEQVASEELDHGLDEALSLLRRLRARLSWRTRAPEAIGRAIARRRRWVR